MFDFFFLNASGLHATMEMMMLGEHYHFSVYMILI